jgi:nucleotide-binding universal stress UspA family protein
MISLKRILVPTDFSQTAHAALKYGVELARTHGATLRVLHVVTEPRHEASVSNTPGWEYMRAVEQLRVQTLKQLEKAVEAEHAGTLPVVLDTAHGEAANEIIRYASERDIALVICGTHGRRAGIDSSWAAWPKSSCDRHRARS